MHKNENKLSIVIITFNEEKNIARCINSVKEIADEIIVVDSYSTDKTKDIALDLGAIVIENKFEGHIEQKNIALQKANYTWVLSLDADEALSDKLKNKIQEIKKNPTADGYTMNRLTYYCGRWIRHTGWYPDKKLRLVRKDLAQWCGINPHDRLELTNSNNIKHINADILHYSYFTLNDHLNQLEKFTQISANELYKYKIKPNFWHFFIKPLHKFINHYIYHAGFLDGYEGFQISMISAYGVFLKYAKLRELYKTNK
ncbi:MAG: glycosyltransferase family 2 protein [Bacteroidales bacterium]|jgi:glycosyltransferase involved in cell wall biosynthesis|nr:glycosyltransferase family 2 protein [Bacteroidales bacterium]MDI9574924.1 glycosyltransferase family 2 protein [Bacteroidota bacterium]MDD2593843.1 glycosyltransferase family 2 protein [Bacteroidales bacterium]MDD3755839.1 glycosyltransferase family 2 protein [Bacteroidales bacterium]MDY0400759.1 glycosyltransferase family 2 protein [Bacteroidales bacterium]